MTLKVFITGASSGIGLALAKQYAEQGATLGLLARREEQLIELNQQLGGKHTIYPVDVCNQEQLHAAAHSFILNVGTPDIVIAAAGISVGTLTEHLEDLEQFKKIFDVNVLAVPNTFHPFIEPMRKLGKGTLVGIASGGATRGQPGSGAYCASKAAIVRYCESLRIEVKKYGISVVTLSPGYIKTPLTAKNPYKMPFLMEVDDFAIKAAQAIGSKKIIHHHTMANGHLDACIDAIAQSTI